MNSTQSQPPPLKNASRAFGPKTFTQPKLAPQVFGPRLVGKLVSMTGQVPDAVYLSKHFYIASVRQQDNDNEYWQ